MQADCHLPGHIFCQKNNKTSSLLFIAIYNGDVAARPLRPSSLKSLKGFDVKDGGRFVLFFFD